MQCSVDGITFAGFLILAAFIALMGGGFSKNPEQRAIGWKAGFIVSGVGLLITWISMC